MYEFNLFQMTSAVLASLGLGEEKRKIVHAAIASHWKGKIAIVWCTDDVFMAIKELGRFSRITEEDAENILASVLDKHDASVGVSWDTLRIFAQDYLNEKNESILKGEEVKT